MLRSRAENDAFVSSVDFFLWNVWGHVQAELAPRIRGRALLEIPEGAVKESFGGLGLRESFKRHQCRAATTVWPLKSMDNWLHLEEA